MGDHTTKNLHNVVNIDENALQSHLNKVVLKTVEDTLNQMLDDHLDRRRRLALSLDWFAPN